MLATFMRSWQQQKGGGGGVCIIFYSVAQRMPKLQIFKMFSVEKNPAALFQYFFQQEDKCPLVIKLVILNTDIHD